MGQSGKSKLLRPALVIALTMASAFALADGGTVFAGTQFDYHAFIAYLVATILFEAWFIGVRAGYGWPKSVLISIGVNFFTAFFCITPEIFFPIYAQKRPQFDPNPFEWMFPPLILYAVVSAFIEGYLWAPKDPQSESLSRRSFVIRSLLGHLACVPISIAILILPAHPYASMERQVLSWRMGALRKTMNGFSQDIQTQGRVPEFRSVEELICRYQPDLLTARPEGSAIPYIPDYSRFDMRDRRRRPIEVNRAAVGVKVTVRRYWNFDPPHRLWLIRGYITDGAVTIYKGYVLDPETGHVHSTNDGEALGYGKVR